MRLLDLDGAAGEGGWWNVRGQPERYAGGPAGQLLVSCTLLVAVEADRPADTVTLRAAHRLRRVEQAVPLLLCVSSQGGLTADYWGANEVCFFFVRVKS